jgi:hypothetical protein
MKGQSTVEFLGAIFLFIVVLVASLTAMSDKIPGFQDSVKESAQNLEMKQVSDQLLSRKGSHSFGSGGANWEKNKSTVSNIENLGLASEHKALNYSKVNSLGTGEEKLSYSDFTELAEVDNQYSFEFVWLPVINTEKSFVRNSTPAEITEPKPDDGSPQYNTSENRVHYGSFKLNGTVYRFLAVAFNGVYDTVYKSNNTNFQNEHEREKVGQNISLGSREFTIEKIQNRADTPGAVIVLKRKFKDFGLNPEALRTEVTKMNRYAALKVHNSTASIARMEVLSW